MTARQGLAVLLGAGFSKWAAGLPIASELFDFALEPFGPRETNRLAEVRRLKSRWDAENPDRGAEEFIAFALAAQPRLRRAVIWHIGRRLCDPYIWTEWHVGRQRRHVLMIDENRASDRPGVVPRQRLSRSARRGHGTPNDELRSSRGVRSRHEGDELRNARRSADWPRSLPSLAVGQPRHSYRQRFSCQDAWKRLLGRERSIYGWAAWAHR